MFILLCIILGIVSFGFILYRFADYCAHRYLGFHATDHTPICTPSSSPSSTVVCVLGWGGCKHRQLRRLLEFYSSNNITTVSWINPMFNYIFGIDRKEIECILDFLLNENRTSKNIIIHVHSNNGTLVWFHMLKLMEGNEHYHKLLSNIKGIIFDSAPLIHSNLSSDGIISSAFGASLPCVSIILNRAQYIHFFWSPLMIYYLFVRFFRQRFFSSDISAPSDKIKELLNIIPTDIKQYYIYSSSDRLIPPHSIGKLAFSFTHYN